MPRLIDYDIVTRRMSGAGFVSLYPNSGAFGFPTGTATQSVGWILQDDASIRPAARAFIQQIDPPDVRTLVRLAVEKWRRELPGPVWLMPKAHWAYELMFGSDTWLPGLLQSVDLDPAILYPRHDGTAIEFSLEETPAFEILTRGLLENLLGSDFMLAWPDRKVVCTVHHHKQLWWEMRSEMQKSE